MMATNSLSSNSQLDLRAPVLTQLRRGIGVRWLRAITLVLLDTTTLHIAWHLAETYGAPLNYPWDARYSFLGLLPIIAVQMSLIAARGLYTSGQKRCDYLSLIKALTFFHILLLLITFLYQPFNFISRPTFITSWLLGVLLTCTVRLGIDTVIKYIRKQGAICYPTFLICYPEDKEKATELVEAENCYNLLGWADVNTIAKDREQLDATLKQIHKLGVAEVFVCSWDSIENRVFLYWKLINSGITLHIVLLELETVRRNLDFRIIGSLPVFKLSPPLIAGSDFLIKRYFDFCFSAFLSLLTAPLYVFIALLIKLDSPGPVFYKQTRIGLHGKPFKVWKFRTMVANAEQLQKQLETSNEMKDGVLFKIKNDPRITRVGKFLRRYSLDELPQLFNVLFGQMSLVGPRPLPVRDVEKFSEHHFIRHEVLPGITGLWQVSYRSDVTDFEKVLHLDMTYMENWSLWLDLQILLQTILVVIRKKGAY